MVKNVFIYRINSLINSKTFSKLYRAVRKSANLIKKVVEIIKDLVNCDLIWTRRITGFDKVLFVGLVKGKAVDSSVNTVVYKRPYLTIQQNGNLLIVTYVAKDRKEENNMGKIILNCVKEVKKCGYDLEILILKYLEVLYEVKDYGDLPLIVDRLYKADCKPRLFQYVDEKNRYWKNGNYETFVRKKLVNGIRNFVVPIDEHVAVHGYYKNGGEIRVELQISRINFPVFEKKGDYEVEE